MNFNFYKKVKTKMIVNIEQKIPIESMYLDKNINLNILNKLKNDMGGKCTLEYGYILDIIKIIKIGDNKISSANSLTVFDVIYQADVLKPTEGLILSGKVCMIFQHGIFVDIKGKMKVLIPATTIDSFSYDAEDSSFETSNTKISNGASVDIEIVLIKYEKKNFSCIGKLKNENT